MTNNNKYRHLSFEERFVIEKLIKYQVAVREIARFLGRSPNTISREIRKNSVKGVYTAGKANKRAKYKRWRAKRQCLKVAMDMFLYRFVERRICEYWSPEQIGGYLKTQLGISCSAKAIYKFARRRSLDRFLFWNWNNMKSGHKRYQYDTPKDNRKYIDVRPVVEGVGHYELDFIVSSQSAWVLLVAVDMVSKRKTVLKLPNRKRATVLGALSALFVGVTVQSITTDNDIAFVCWREIESLLGTQVYFTHPYHSWEKGLVENTNRWIRCFVAKKRDIASVTEEEMQRIHSFLNDRPSEVIGFKLPSMYHYQLSVLS